MMAPSNRPSFRPIYCTGSTYGMPDFGAKYVFIEQIKEVVESRRLSQPDVPPRQVALVTKGAKENGPYNTHCIEASKHSQAMSCAGFYIGH